MRNSQNVKLKPKVSIITVCFNEGGDIENTCKSVVFQNYNDYEWIVVDGGSTDKTLEILNKYKSSISVLISEKDRGVYDAMNKGIKIAKGEYLLFLNGGDYLYNNKVLRKVFHKNLYIGDVLYGNCCVLKKFEKPVMLDFSKNINKAFFLADCINHQSTFIKKDLFKKYGLYDEGYNILADYEKWIYFAKNNSKFKKIPFIVSNFKGFDGLSSREKTKLAVKKEKEAIISKHFNKIELLIFKTRVFLKLCKTFFYKSINSIKNLLLKIKFVFFSPKEFIVKYLYIIKNYWYKFLNSPLRQPVRKVWYFVKNKKLNK